MVDFQKPLLYLQQEPVQFFDTRAVLRSLNTRQSAESEQHERLSELEEEQQDKTDESPPVIQSSELFQLSGELRNTIDRYVLLEPENIQVTSTGYSRNGGLLGACKEIRAETFAIFYNENKFEFTARNFDSFPLVHWH